MSLKLVPVLNTDETAFHKNALFLYDLLKSRDPAANISHRSIPPFYMHLAFIQSEPYEAWYIAELDGEKIASVYLTKPGPGMYGDEIGLFLVKGRRGQGLGTRILNLLMAEHPRKRYLANIAPSNNAGRSFFVGQGFRHIQNTYELRGE